MFDQLVSSVLLYLCMLENDLTSEVWTVEEKKTFALKGVQKLTLSLPSNLSKVLNMGVIWNIMD